MCYTLWSNIVFNPYVTSLHSSTSEFLTLILTFSPLVIKNDLVILIYKLNQLYNIYLKMYEYLYF